MKSNNMKRYYENKQTVQILKKIYIYILNISKIVLILIITIILYSKRLNKNVKLSKLWAY